MQEIVCFSGGRTSAKMLEMLMKQYGDSFNDVFLVLFANAGKERDETLDFVHEVEVRWEVPVVWLEYTRVPAIDINPEWFPSKRHKTNLLKRQQAGGMDHWFKVVNYETAARRDDPRPFNELLNWMSVLPNPTSRACTVQLKMRTMMRYLFWRGIHFWKNSIGIRADEADRASDIRQSKSLYEIPQFPLISAGITEADVMEFWKSQPFDLGIPSEEGNCDICFLKSKAKKLRIIRKYPHFADWWIGWERTKGATCNGDGGRFRRGESYAGMLSDTKQPNLFGDENDEACACMSGGYTWEDEEDLECAI